MKSRVFLPALLSGFLLWFAFFPWNFGPIAFVALVPFLAMVRAEGVGRFRRYFAAWLGGVLFFALALNWIRVAHPMMALFAWPGLTLVCSLFWPLALFLLRRLDRWHLPFALTLPLVWVGLEYVRAHFPTGFPFLAYVNAQHLVGFGWYALGYTQHSFTMLIQAADLGGVYLISGAIAAVNGALYDWLIRSQRVQRMLRVTLPVRPIGFVRESWIAAGAAAYFLGLIAYGMAALSHPPYAVGPRVAAIQGNLPQNLKNFPDDPNASNSFESEYFTPALLAAKGDARAPKPDLLIWPETCFPAEWMVIAPDEASRSSAPQEDQKYAERIHMHLRDYVGTRLRTNTLLGLNAIEWKDGRRSKTNTALLIRADGSFAERYDKMHLVPFGEYVPLRSTLPWLQSFTPYDYDYSCTPGEHATRFELATDHGTYRFGVLICYEDSDPQMARMYNSATGNGVDFLVNISNDGWFDGTEEHEQHLAICRFRAIETRRSIIRAVNMGISAAIDPDGRILALPVADSWAKSKKSRGIVRAELPIGTQSTLYAAYGDWFPILCCAAVGMALIGSARGRSGKQSSVQTA